MNKRIIGIALIILVFILHRFIPIPQGLDELGVKTLALLLIAILFWVTNAIPIGISSIFILILPVLMGITTLKDMLTAFPNPTIFFVLATFGISASMSKLPIAKRILIFLLKKMGNDINKFILAIMLATALISSIMSNIPATMLFMGISLSFLELYDTEEEKKRTGRAMMIALPVAAMIELIPTPAGSSNYILALGLLNEYAGVNIRFIDFMIICTPVAMVIVPLAWFLIVKIFKPAPINKEKIQAFVEEFKHMGKPDKKEIFVVSIVLTMVVLWILSSWVPVFDVTIVSICGLVVMFLPKIDILNWKDFKEEVSWDVILMVGCVLCVGSLILKSGVAQWMSGVLFNVGAGTSVTLLILQLALFMYVMQLVLPNAPAVISATTLPVIMIATAIGINPAVLILPLCLFSSWTMILPLSAVPMMTYSKGYYAMTDIGKVGVPILAALALILSLWVPFIMKALSYV